MSNIATVTEESARFNDAWWNAQPPEVRALRNIDDKDQRGAAAYSLATRGIIIDGPIVWWGLEPYWIMRYREAMGFTWVTNLLQPNIQAAPGQGHPGAVYDPDNPPKGSIKVSTKVSDYPPFDPPAKPAPPVSNNSPIGGLNYGNIYFSQPWDDEPHGKQITNERGTFRKFAIGWAEWWEKQAA